MQEIAENKQNQCIILIENNQKKGEEESSARMQWKPHAQ
jgi:hypothetical protein